MKERSDTKVRFNPAIPNARASDQDISLLPDRLIIVAREGWGNTDFLEFGRASSELGIEVHFVGYPSQQSVDFTPEVHPPAFDLGPVAFAREAARLCRGIINNDRTKVNAIHVRYFKLCCLLPLFIGARTAVDFRSGSIRNSGIVRLIENRLMQIEAKAFDLATVISNEVGLHLGLRRFQEIPLGAPASLLEISRDRQPDPSRLRFLYIGTLRQRNLHVFAKSFEDFIAKQGLDWTLDIHGYGSEQEIGYLQEISQRCMNVRYLGPLARSEVPKRLAEADVGVSFVPMTPYFDLQPPTKTYEYLMAGLPTLATRTKGNIQIIANSFGWLCDDTSASIDEAMSRIAHAGGIWSVNRDVLRNHTWEVIFAERYRKEILRRSFWNFQ